MGIAKSILIVEDEELIQAVLRQILATEGHKSTVVKTGQEALNLPELGSGFDLILLDHGLPDMTGLELSNRVSEITPQTPIVLISGNPDLLESKLPSHVAAVVAKPFNLNALLELVRRLA